MKKSSLKPDLIIALMALVIGIGTMIVYVYQARIMSKQQHASVWPFLEVSITQGQLGTYISVENKGVGPAIERLKWIALPTRKIKLMKSFSK